MVGARIREVRQSQRLSLNDVAGKAGISASTLSRIETEKQALDLPLFLLIARILGVDASSILDGDGRNEGDPLAMRIACLDSRGRTDLWRELAAERRGRTKRRRRGETPVDQVMEELLAQVDLLREQVEGMRRRTRRRK